MEMDKDQQLNNLFAQARTETPKIGFEEMKGGFLTQVEIPTTETSNLLTIKTWTIMIATVVTTGISIAFLTGLFNTATLPEEHDFDKELVSALELSSNELAQIEITESDFEFLDIENPEVFRPKFSQEELAELVTVPDSIDPYGLTEELAGFTDSTIKNEPYRYPTLTGEQKKMYTKQKAKMMKQLIKRDKKLFVYIPSGSFDQEGKSVSVRSFHMQISEVTNFQYRTFLFDLLEQGKRSDFLEAKPDQSLWERDYPEYNQPMVDMYFSHPAYNEYPVNNISRKGAELFTYWLTSQANIVMKSKHKPQINDVRLPTINEWVYAAKGGLQKPTYPWGGPYEKNSKGCYLANFNPKGESPDEDGSMYTAKAQSYSPNGYGLYCMSGNLAEMVYYSTNKSKPGTKGGSFLSSSANIQINGKDEFKGVTSPNVNIGFRVVISYGIVGVKGK
ncbi:MAG: sulfatase activating formylglycine-generating enzyme [Halieaceae bacterium]|jgi:formylglycine-generating enzyme required for sulfatase activity